MQLEWHIFKDVAYVHITYMLYFQIGLMCHTHRACYRGSFVPPNKLNTQLWWSHHDGQLTSTATLTLLLLKAKAGENTMERAQWKG